jgi:hypothetical protein
MLVDLNGMFIRSPSDIFAAGWFLEGMPGRIIVNNRRLTDAG